MRLHNAGNQVQSFQSVDIIRNVVSCSASFLVSEKSQPHSFLVNLIGIVVARRAAFLFSTWEVNIYSLVVEVVTQKLSVQK